MELLPEELEVARVYSSYFDLITLLFKAIKEDCALYTPVHQACEYILELHLIRIKGQATC